MYSLWSCQFISLLHIHPSLPCFVILELSPMSIFLLPGRELLSFSVDGIGETLNEEVAFLPSSKMLFYSCSKSELQPVACRIPSVPHILSWVLMALTVSWDSQWDSSSSAPESCINTLSTLTHVPLSGGILILFAASPSFLNIWSFICNSCLITFSTNSINCMVPWNFSHLGLPWLPSLSFQFRDTA